MRDFNEIVDLLLHPNIYIVNPDDYEYLKDNLPGFEEQKDYFVPIGLLEKGKAFVIDRAKVNEEMEKTLLSGDFTKEYFEKIREALIH